MSCALLDRTRELLKNRGDRSVQQIAKETGLPYSWLNSMLYSRQHQQSRDPSVTKVVTLYEYLSGKKLDV